MVVPPTIGNKDPPRTEVVVESVILEIVVQGWGKYPIHLATF